MWWQEHWVELATLVAIAGAWADMRAYIRRVDEREREHHATNEKRLDAHSRRMSEIEADYHRVINKCPLIRDQHLKRDPP